jgi:hypothetical protein
MTGLCLLWQSKYNKEKSFSAFMYATLQWRQSVALASRTYQVSKSVLINPVCNVTFHCYLECGFVQRTSRVKMLASVENFKFDNVGV